MIGAHSLTVRPSSRRPGELAVRAADVKVVVQIPDRGLTGSISFAACHVSGAFTLACHVSKAFTCLQA